MPEADLDRKITLADDDPPQNEAPPESFWLSKDAEYDWFDRNAFYERKDSKRANSNSTSSSQRFPVTLKPKASIFGLPKAQKTAFMESKRRACKPASIRLFPKRSESKAAVPVVEPGSPKVSCMGRVRSKRGRRRSNSVKKPGEKAKTGICSRVMSLFRSKKGGNGRVMEIVMVDDGEPAPRKSVSVEVRGVPVSGELPGLGGITRFASGRRSGSWVAEEINQAGFDG
ncbi:hypothetical protein SASPL_111774 [Salvia splendens]|uniref:Uncharacterized protein n=1 Tax=Salvia splendens TaxID=180675 RepID=A0A8X9A3Y9_SALSN|nr:uncharacterized protein LOC121800808 [Salvia splendens]KAG6427528.1 hypothetical protein SASPL_111774 [Salvia splendens]